MAIICRTKENKKIEPSKATNCFKLLRFQRSLMLAKCFGDLNVFIVGMLEEGKSK